MVLTITSVFEKHDNVKRFNTLFQIIKNDIKVTILFLYSTLCDIVWEGNTQN
jgi:hypothetical protein